MLLGMRSGLATCQLPVLSTTTALPDHKAGPCQQQPLLADAARYSIRPWYQREATVVHCLLSRRRCCCANSQSQPGLDAKGFALYGAGTTSQHCAMWLILSHTQM